MRAQDSSPRGQALTGRIGLQTAFGLTAVVTLLTTVGVARAERKVWDGSDASANWNVAANWTPSGVPASTDDVVFDGTGDDSVTVSATTTVASISIQSGYDGTITINSGVTLNADNVSINDGLIGYWRFDESADGTAVDSSGHGSDLTHQNTPSFNSSPPTGLFNNPYAVTFAKASSEYASRATLPEVLKVSTWTVSAWIKTSSIDTNGAEIVDINNNIGLRIDAPDDLRVFNYNGTNYKHCEATAVSLLDNAWHHVVGSFDGTGFQLYVDGSQVTASLSDADGGTDCTPFAAQAWSGTLATPPLRIGGKQTNSTVYDFDGSIDDVRVYGRVLSATEVAFLNAKMHLPLASNTQTIAGTGTLDISGDLTIASRSVSFSAATTINVGGSFYNFGGTTSGSATITLDGSGTQEVGGLGGPIHAFTAGGTATRTLIDRLWVTDALTISGGTFDISNRIVHAGTISQSSGSVTSTGSTVVIDSSSSKTVTASSALNNLRIEQPTETSLVGHWKLDELTGTSTRDRSATGNNGTLNNGATWASSSGLTGIDFANEGVVEFAGATDSVSFAVAHYTPITISAWIYMTANGGGNFPRIVGLPSMNFLIRSADGDKLAFDADWSMTDPSWKTAGGITRSTWTHVAVTWTGSTTAPTLCIAGTCETATVHSAAAGSYNSASGNGYIGNNAASTRNFVGKIDDVRIYNAVLSDDQIKALAAGGYAGTGGASTFTLGANTTVNSTLAVDSGTLAASSFTMTTANTDATKVAYVYGAGAYTAGTAASSFKGGLTVERSGTLTMGGASGSVQLGSGKSLLIDGSLVSAIGATNKPTIKSVSGTYTFSVGTSATATPTLNIDGLAVQNTDTNGMFINQTAGAVTTFTKFDNLAFSAGTGNYLLQIAANSLTLFANGLSFDTTGTNATYNVRLLDRNGAGNDVTMFIGGTCTASEDDCEAHDSDDDATGVLSSSFDGVADSGGAVVQWGHRGYSDVGGAIETFPAVAFDWDTFVYHATYVLTNNYSGTDDRLVKRTTDGAQHHASATWDLPNDENFVGAPRWVESSNTYYVYVLSTAGRVYKLQDAGNSFTLLATFQDGASATGTSPLILDSTHLYWGGASGTGVVSMLKLLQSDMSTASSVATGAVYAAPSLYTISGTKYLFSAAASNVYKINTSFAPATALSLTNTTVRGRVSVINGVVYFVDDSGKFWAVDGASMAELWSYQDTPTHTTCSSGSNCESRNIYWDVLLSRAYYGDKDGHVYAVSRNGSTSGGTLLWATPFDTGSDVFQTSPIYRAGVIGIGSTAGRVFFIDQRNASNAAALIRAFYFGNTAINSIVYDFDGAQYVVSTGDGKLYYINASVVADPTSGNI